MHTWKKLYTIFQNFVEKSQTLQIKSFPVLLKKLWQKNEQNVKIRFFVFNKNLIILLQAQPYRQTSLPVHRTKSERQECPDDIFL